MLSERRQSHKDSAVWLQLCEGLTRVHGDRKWADGAGGELGELLSPGDRVSVLR